MKRFGLALVIVLLAMGGQKPANAAITLYSDITTFSGQGFAGGGAGAVTLSGTAGNLTAMTADDITTVAPNGGTVTGVTFSVANFNAAAVSAQVVLSFYDTTGTGGGPGAYLGGLIFNPISFTAGSVQNFGYNPGTTIFNLPTAGALGGGSFWVGEQFFSSTATTAQLNNLGEGIFGPPTVGSSQDVFFQSTSYTSSLTSNPTGGFEYFNGSPVANFGFAFTGTAIAVPEPGSLALCGLALVVGAGIARSRSRRTASAA
jgi:hypothetical protein